MKQTHFNALSLSRIGHDCHSTAQTMRGNLSAIPSVCRYRDELHARTECTPRKEELLEPLVVWAARLFPPYPEELIFPSQVGALVRATFISVKANSKFRLWVHTSWSDSAQIPRSPRESTFDSCNVQWSGSHYSSFFRRKWRTVVNTNNKKRSKTNTHERTKSLQVVQFCSWRLHATITLQIYCYEMLLYSSIRRISTVLLDGGERIRWHKTGKR